MKATDEQVQEWKAAYGSVFELEAEGRVFYLSDPLQKLTTMKALLIALSKGSINYVEAIMTHCWIGGDASVKTDDKIKIGLIDQLQDLIEIPDHEIDFLDGEAVITVEGMTCRVRMATKNEIKYAEDRNKGNKPLDTQIYLLEKIALDDLSPWRANTRLYMGLLLAMDKVKERKYVSLTKL